MQQDNDIPPQTPEEKLKKLENQKLRVRDALDGFSLEAVAQLVAEIDAEILKLEEAEKSKSKR